MAPIANPSGRTLAVALSVFATLVRAQCPPEVFEQIRREGEEHSQVMQHLDHLTNRIGPRLTGSDNCTNACEWAVSKLKEFGIDNARMEKWGTFPVGWTRGQWSGEMLEPVQETLVFGTEAWTAGTVGPVMAHAVLEPVNEAELETVRATLKGAWVVKRPGPASAGGRGRRGAGGDSRPAESRPREVEPRPSAELSQQFTALCKSVGIAGTIVATSNIDERYPLQVRVFGRYQISWDKLPTDVVVHLRRDQHKKLCDFLKDGKKVSLRFDIRNYFKQGPIDVYNVIGDIPGTEKPEEYVVAGGHIDSWHQATGTTDNGTGVATTLEAARILAKVGVKPRRTIRFMLWSGEEQGLMGSAAFVKKYRTQMDQYSAAFVHDMGTNYLSGLGVTADMKEAMEKVVAPLLTLDQAMPFTLRVVQGLGGGGSDHGSFLSAGVPGLAWSQAGDAVYGRTWHSQWDTFDAAIPAYQRHSAVVVATTALGVANLPEVLPRVKTGARNTGGAGGFGRFAEMMGLELEGLKVTKVADKGWAADAGLKAGDEIVAIDGEALESRRELARLFGEESDKAARIKVKRDGKDVELTAKRLRGPQ